MLQISLANACFFRCDFHCIPLLPGKKTYWATSSEVKWNLPSPRLTQTTVIDGNSNSLCLDESGLQPPYSDLFGRALHILLPYEMYNSCLPICFFIK